MPAQNDRPAVTITQSDNKHAGIERHELRMLSKKALVDLFRSIQEVVCYKDVTEDGETTQVGIPPHYMKEKFDYLLKHDLEYGEEGGVKRKAEFVYVYKKRQDNSERRYSFKWRAHRVCARVLTGAHIPSSPTALCSEQRFTSRCYAGTTQRCSTARCCERRARPGRW